MSFSSDSSQQILLKTTFAVLAIVLGLLLFKPLIVGWANSEIAKEQPKATPRSLAPASAGDDDSVKSESLVKQIDEIIEKSELASARWGVSVISLSDGQTVYSRNAKRLFTPASNMKIFTTGVALDLLGSDYRWRTSVYADTQPDANGTINGDLRLYGRGAPDLVTLKTNANPSLAQLAEDLYNRGVRRVSGNVIGDESYFRGEPVGDGWQWSDLQWYFGAEASALTINGNEIDINILPPDKSGSPPIANLNDASGYISVQNNMAVGTHGERMIVGIHRGLSDNNVQVWGELPRDSKGFGARLSVHNPALWAARLFLAQLKSRGILVEGVAEVRDSRQPANARFDPAHAVELAFVSSESLSETAKATNKESVNLNAELILRTLGRELGNMVSAPDPMGRERGDEESGLAVIQLWLTHAGIPTQGIAFHDGSGLSRLNLVTPESISRFLVALAKTASGSNFRQSLPVSGRDGTLGGRLTDVTDLVAAKTGSLTYDTALSGYVTSADGKIFAFSIISNDQTLHTSSARLIDQIVLVLARGRPAERN
jgi:serine-type D-Ala-D-Ala carboxypeptidase/endopeptidase (penicillin-binding protein 4)